MSTILSILIILSIPLTIVLIAIFSRKDLEGQSKPPSHILTLFAIISGIIAVLAIVALAFPVIIGVELNTIAEIYGIPIGLFYSLYIANIIFYISFVSIVLYLDYLHKRLQILEEKVDEK